ncbi:hypothetical protein ACTFIU_007512 [Dictyostelium citrinum]
MIRNTTTNKFVGNNSNNNIVDTNYETLKNEFSKLSQNILTIYNSLNNNNKTMKDIYLNSNSFLNSLSNYYHSSNNNGYETEHPLGNYSNQILINVHKTFEEWEYNQSGHFQSLNDYCNQIEQTKSKIQRLDKEIANTDSQEYQTLKNQIFKDVQHLFDSRVNQFDIPLINIQFSFNSCLQSLNSNHNDSSFLLQQPINFNNPVQSLKPLNNNNNNSVTPLRAAPPVNNNNNNSNHLQQIPRPITSYIPPKQYVPSPQQHQQQYIPPQPYTPPQQQQQQPHQYTSPQPYSPQQYQEQVYVQSQQSPPPPEQPPSSGPRKGKSQLKQIERPAQVDLPDKSVIEPSIKRKPGDFLRDPNAPRFVPDSYQQKQHVSNKPSMEHHSMSLSESYKQRVVLSNDINEHGSQGVDNHSNTTAPPIRKLDNSIRAPPSRPTPLPK